MPNDVFNLYMDKMYGSFWSEGRNFYIWVYEFRTVYLLFSFNKFSMSSYSLKIKKKKVRCTCSYSDGQADCSRSRAEYDMVW